MKNINKIKLPCSVYVLRLCLLPVVAVMLTACGQDMSDLNRYINEVKARPAKPIEPIPVIKPYMRFIYPGHDLDNFWKNFRWTA